MFWMHNETINIWTHLLGFVYFVYLMERNFTTEQPHNRSDKRACTHFFVTKLLYKSRCLSVRNAMEEMRFSHLILKIDI